MAKYEILETKDYDMFKYQPGNRIKSKAHIQELIRSFEKHRHMRIGRPVIINRDNQVIDGQHSLEAARALGMSIFYVQIDEAKLSDTRVLNSTNRQWNMEDFIRSWANQIPIYRRVLEIHDEYPIAYSLLISFLTGYMPGGKVSKMIRNGDLVIHEREGRAKLDQLVDFSNHLSTWNKDSFVTAVIRLLRVEGYDHERMLKKLEGIQLTKRSTFLEHLRDLETIYNKGAQKYTPFIGRE